MQKRIACAVFIALILTSMLLLMIRILPVKAWNGTVHIHADGSVDPSTAPIQQSGSFYALTDNITSDGDGIIIERNGTMIQGAGYTIQGNYAGAGINMTSVDNITIKNINVQGFNYGIFLASASQNNIIGNNVTTNDIGMALVASSDYNDIAGNNIRENNAFGIWIDGSSNNNIYHNNFVDNAIQCTTYDSINIWDNGYPSGGNYWSTYTGTDSDNDGIGDTPYTIDASNSDRYPLMKPWSPILGDVNYDGKVSLQDLVILAKAYGSKPGDPNWNPDADIVPPWGIIGLTDLVALALHYGQHNP
jgi:parallel beta-helix repeat protein